MKEGSASVAASEEKGAGAGDQLKGMGGEVAKVAQEKIAGTQQRQQVAGGGLVIAGERGEGKRDKAFGEQIEDALDAGAGGVAKGIGRAREAREMGGRQSEASAVLNENAREGRRRQRTGAKLEAQQVRKNPG